MLRCSDFSCGANRAAARSAEKLLSRLPGIFRKLMPRLSGQKKGGPKSVKLASDF